LEQFAANVIQPIIRFALIVTIQRYQIITFMTALVKHALEIVHLGIIWLILYVRHAQITVFNAVTLQQLVRAVIAA
jgi:hypothetical protein